MKKYTLSLLRCIKCKKEKFILNTFSKEKDDILSGLIKCKNCNAWYPIIDGIGIFLKQSLLINLGFINKFIKLNNKYFKNIKIDKGDDDPTETQKREQIEFFNDHAYEYDKLFPETPFWNANDNLTLYEWCKIVKNSDLVVDIGGGTGRSSIPFAIEGANVISLDISFEMVKKARSKVKNLSLENKIDFLVADCENLPLKDNIANVGVMLGVLHHISNPQIALNELSRILKKRGLYFGHENNKTILRPIFDMIMKIWRLHEEKAGEYALISKDEMKAWASNSSLEVDIKTSTFLPPHLLNFIGKKLAIPLLYISDKLFNMFPFIKNQGGALIISGKKL